MTLLVSCAANPENPDPYEKTNRSLYKLNEDIDKWVLKPLSKIYEGIFPKPARTCIDNGFNNLHYGNVIVNDFLQGKFRQGRHDLERMAVNSTLGIGGLFDVGTRLNRPKNKNDFGITLGIWGVGPGPYLLIPVVGPLTLRDVPGIGVGLVTNPLFWVSTPLAVDIPLDVVETANARSQGDLLARFRNEAAIDPYVFTRDAYLQHRESQIHPVQATPAKDQDLYDVDDTPPTTRPATNPDSSVPAASRVSQ